MRALQGLRLFVRNLVAREDMDPMDPAAGRVAEEYEGLLASLGTTPTEAVDASTLDLEDPGLVELRDQYGVTAD